MSENYPRGELERRLSRQIEASACRPWGGEKLEAFEEEKGSQHTQKFMCVEMTIMG